jgi:hypothetical protein
MKGAEFIDAIKAQYELESDAELAEELGYTQGRISQIRSRNVSMRTIVNVTSKIATAVLKERIDSIRPIVEFFPIGEDAKSERSFLDLSQSDQKALQVLLKKTPGIYSFYNSELEIVYIGKTKGDLWMEMCSSFNRSMGNYKRFHVAHPRDRYSSRLDGLSRDIVNKKIYLRDTATYFSAYAISAELVDIFETLLIRIVPNDILNVRIEGNISLLAFRDTEE